MVAMILPLYFTVTTMLPWFMVLYGNPGATLVLLYYYITIIAWFNYGTLW